MDIIKRKKYNKGITLISLVVTIVILLILAGIAIATLTGENGILKKASKSAEQYKMETAREKVILAMAEYEVKMKKETLYSILNKIEGLESIEPDNEQAGLPYTIVVDGYEFLIKEDREIEYIGPSNGVVPEININKKFINEQEIKIEVHAKTQDEEGLLKLVLIKDGIEIEQKQVTGKEMTDEFIVKDNGKYTIKVVGNNRKIKISNEIEVNEINTLTVTLQAGTVIEGKVLLTVTGTTKSDEITKLEIHDGINKIKEIDYHDKKQHIYEEVEIEDIVFYEEKKYVAKLIDSTGKEKNSNQINVKNMDTIKMRTRFKKISDRSK